VYSNAAIASRCVEHSAADLELPLHAILRKQYVQITHTLGCCGTCVFCTTGKGGKNRRRGKNDSEETKRELEYKEFGQEYAQVVRMLGNGRCECYCYDGVTRLGHIRGKMRKKVWVSAGDIVLCGLREYQDDKVDIIHRYVASSR
jgi:initiation factor 1A